MEHREDGTIVDASISKRLYIEELWGCKQEFGVGEWERGFGQDLLVQNVYQCQTAALDECCYGREKVEQRFDKDRIPRAIEREALHIGLHQLQGQTDSPDRD